MAILFILIFFIGVGLILGLLSRVLIGISQANFFRGWLCLELNIIIFLILINTLEKRRPRARIKYFIIQSVGSSVFLWSVGLEGARLGLAREISIRRALGLKLGIAPFQR